jgi:hypothetical protein
MDNEDEAFTWLQKAYFILLSPASKWTHSTTGCAPTHVFKTCCSASASRTAANNLFFRGVSGVFRQATDNNNVISYFAGNRGMVDA